MVLVRGNNVYPSAIEAVLRSLRGVAEWQGIVTRGGDGPADLVLVIEPEPGIDPQPLADAVRRAVQDALFFRPEVRIAPARSLPRYEMKARRFVDPEERTP
jgi:phenylacetate-CoA ligase